MLFALKLTRERVQSQKEKQQQIEWKEAVYHQLMTAVSPDCSAAQPCIPSRDPGQSWSEILQSLRQCLVQDDPPLVHTNICQIILEDMAEGATSLWLLEDPSCGNSLGRANLCFLNEDRLPSEKHRK